MLTTRYSYEGLPWAESAQGELTYLQVDGNFRHVAGALGDVSEEAGSMASSMAGRNTLLLSEADAIRAALSDRMVAIADCAGLVAAFADAYRAATPAGAVDLGGEIGADLSLNVRRVLRTTRYSTRDREFVQVDRNLDFVGAVSFVLRKDASGALEAYVETGVPGSEGVTDMAYREKTYPLSYPCGVRGLYVPLYMVPRAFVADHGGEVDVRLLCEAPGGPVEVFRICTDLDKVGASTGYLFGTDDNGWTYMPDYAQYVESLAPTGFLPLFLKVSEGHILATKENPAKGTI